MRVAIVPPQIPRDLVSAPEREIISKTTRGIRSPGIERPIKTKGRDALSL